MTVTVHHGRADGAVAAEMDPTPRVVCIRESEPPENRARLVLDGADGVVVDEVLLADLEGYLVRLGTRPLMGALVFSDRVESCPASVRALRDRPELRRTRIYLLQPSPDVPVDPCEEEYDIEGFRDRDAVGDSELSQLVRNCVHAYEALGSNPLVPRHYLDAKFNEVFDWFEETRWEWKERDDLSGIRRDLLTDDLIEMAKRSCIAEFGTLPAIHNFLREWADEYSFSSWAVGWAAEEARHSLILSRYLRELGVEVMAKHAMYKRQPYPMGDTRAGTLMMNMISESRASEYYALMHELTEEPVLRGIWERLSRDEARHASAFFRFCQELCEYDADNLVSAIEMAYVWLADRSEGMKHPAGLFYAHSATTAHFRQSERYLQGHRVHVTDDADARVLRMIRKLTGDRSISTTRDIKHWLRAHL